jgi:PAS domain S-box-containing protein
MKAPSGEKSRASAANEVSLEHAGASLWPFTLRRPRPWAADAFAIVLAAATLGLRLALTDQLRDRPILVVFTLPIILSAYVGGRRAGLLATALCCLGANYYLLPPFRSLVVASAVDRWDLFFLVACGVAISCLCEALHRARDLQRARSAALQLVAIVESSWDAIIGKDLNGIVTSWNAAAERMFGYTAAEMVGQSIMRIVPASRHGDEALILSSIKNGAWIEHFETERIRKDGTLICISVTVSPIRDAHGKVIGASKTVRDITAQKQARDAQRQGEAQLQAIVENISEAVVVSDLDGNLLHFNHAAMEMLGYASVEEGRRRMSDIADTFELSAPDGTPWTVDQWPLARILRGETLHNLEARMRRIGSNWQRIYNFGGTIATDVGGNPLMAVVTFSDITTRKAIETLLQEQRLALEMVNLTLARKNEELSALYQTAQRFMDDVSHEFRTPLSVIKGYSELMHADLAGPQTDEQKHFSQVIIDRTRDMAQMVDDLLDSSKLRAGSLRVDRKPCAITAIFAALHAIVDSRAKASGIQWVEAIEPGLPLVFADIDKATRVMVNLAVNAIKFSPEGSRITLSARRAPDGQVRIGVADEGPGISPEDLELIFQRFRQVGTGIERTKGFGLGLNIARELVTLNLGEMTAASVLDQGSTFSFTLPIHDPAVIVGRLFKHLEHSATPAGQFAVLRVTPQCKELHGSPDVLRGFVASSAQADDLILSARDGGALILLGYSLEPEAWHRRIAAAGSTIEKFTPSQKLCPFDVELVHVVPYPTPADAVIALVRAQLEKENIHA